MTYSRRALRDLAGLDRAVRKSIERDVAAQLTSTSRCHAKKFRTSKNCHILLVGPGRNYRALVTLPTAEVVTIGDRKDIYRRSL